MCQLFKGGQKRKQILAICFAYLLVAVAPISAKIAGMQIVYSNTFFRAIQFLIGIMIYRFVIEEKVKWIITNKLISMKFSVEIFSIIIIAATYIMSRIGGNYTCYEFYTVPLYSLLIMSLYIRKYKYIPVFTNMVLFLSKMSYTIYLAYHCSFYIGDYLTSKFSINHNIKILMYIALDIIIAYVFMRLQNLITKTYYILTEKEKRRE